MIRDPSAAGFSGYGLYLLKGKAGSLFYNMAGF